MKFKIDNFFKLTVIMKNWPKFLYHYLFPKGRDVNITLKLKNNLKIIIPSTRTAIGVFIETFIHDNYFFVITKPEVILDIGGFLGMSALYYYNLYKNISELHVYEPFTRNYEYILNNIQINRLENQITPHLIAISGKDSKEDFIFSDKDFGGATLKSATNSELKDQLKIKIKTTSLNTILKEIESNHIHIKMDVEGSEYDIFYNTNIKLLHKCDSIVLECHYRDDDKRNKESLMKWFENNGYVGIIEPNKNNPRLSLLFLRKK